MRALKFYITMLLVAFAAVAFQAERAHAGIIIVLGKVTDEAAARQAKAGVALPDRPATTSGTTTCTSEPATDKTSVPSSSCGLRMDPVTGLPAGYDCRPIGRGVYYCVASDTGAGAGAGGAGEFDPSADGWDELDESEAVDAEDEMAVMGCTGGAGAPGLMGLMAAFGALVVLARARRGR